MATYIFYSPHQDDEALSYAVLIRNLIRAGHTVIMVLYTDGKGSFVQKVLNREIDPSTGNPYSSNYWGGYHSPTREGYNPLSDDEFSQARTNEFKASVAQLGVSPANTFVDPVDATVDNLKTLIRKYEALYPNAIHCGMSHLDTAESHNVSGKALKQLHASNEIVSPILVVCRGDWAETRPGTVVGLTNSADLTLLKRSARVYEAWNPVAGSFAIGYHSVWYQFQAVLANPQYKWHGPNA